MSPWLLGGAMVYASTKFSGAFTGLGILVGTFGLYFSTLKDSSA